MYICFESNPNCLNLEYKNSYFLGIDSLFCVVYLCGVRKSQRNEKKS